MELSVMNTTDTLITLSPSDARPGAVPGTERRWWQRPWIGPLALVSVIFIAFSLPPYLSLDPRQSRVPQPDGFAAHYLILVAHVIFGSVALLTACLQVWPWLRQRHPTVHRITGRVYVFAGVLPAGILGLTIGAFSPFGPLARVSNVLLASLWLVFTLTGYRMARQRRYVEHRRWMLRSFALTASIITNRLWAAIGFLVLSPQLNTLFAGSEKMLMWTIAGLATWLGWVVPLLIAEWWLERDVSARERVRIPATRPTAAQA
jgi:uncharacterized membrane protein